MINNQTSHKMNPTGVASTRGIVGIAVAKSSLCPNSNSGVVNNPHQATQGLNSGDCRMAFPTPSVQPIIKNVSPEN
ncbi:MAG: hypothetical protein KME23_29220 [Goleter apudmare HA4340-LM2]|nr:hypothetical protein [Goleter apudmare HA4340-LM2]